jgi:hypothetical protein
LHFLRVRGRRHPILWRAGRAIELIENIGHVTRDPDPDTISGLKVDPGVGSLSRHARLTGRLSGPDKHPADICRNLQGESRGRLLGCRCGQESFVPRGDAITLTSLFRVVCARKWTTHMLERICPEPFQRRCPRLADAPIPFAPLLPRPNDQ